MSEALRTPCAPSIAAILDLLVETRFNLATETTIQVGMDQAFAEAFGAEAYVRECRLSARDRIDFLVEGGIGIEVKHRRAKAAPTLRQLGRYALHPKIQVLILATGWPMSLPVRIEGVPLYMVSLGKAWL